MISSTRYEMWHRLRRPQIRIEADLVHAPSLAIPPVRDRPFVVTVHDIASSIAQSKISANGIAILKTANLSVSRVSIARVQGVGFGIFDTERLMSWMTVRDLSIRDVTLDPKTAYSEEWYVKYGENMWAAVKGYLDEVTAVAAAPVIEKYTGVLAAADVFTESTTFWVMESIRLDLGYGSQVHP